jgi:O-methyltransferase
MAHGIIDRSVWVADSFQGLPPPDPSVPADSGDKHYTFCELAISLEEVKANFAKYGLLDEQVKFLKGWFADTLPTAPIGSLAVLRADGDMYKSTMDILTALYPKVSSGGFVIIDDYGLAACQQAVTDYRDRFGIVEPITTVDYTWAYWRKA